MVFLMILSFISVCLAPMNMGSGVRGGFTPISLPESPTLLGGSPSTIPLERITTADTHPAVQEGVSFKITQISLAEKIQSSRLEKNLMKIIS